MHEFYSVKSSKPSYWVCAQYHKSYCGKSEKKLVNGALNSEKLQKKHMKHQKYDETVLHYPQNITTSANYSR